MGRRKERGTFTRSKILRAREVKGISGITKIQEGIAQFLKRRYTKEVLDIKYLEDVRYYKIHDLSALMLKVQLYLFQFLLCCLYRYVCYYIHI